MTARAHRELLNEVAPRRATAAGLGAKGRLRVHPLHDVLFSEQSGLADQNGPPILKQQQQQQHRDSRL